jgi:hypothetical protein
MVYAQVANKATEEDSEVMEPAPQGYGKPNPDAPAELSQFAFLIGRWRCESKVKGPDGVWTTYRATWVGRYILDGYVIADEYRMTTPTGELLVLGINLRSYGAKKIWTMKWLNALAGTWVDLGPEELGGVKIGKESISYSFKEPVAAHAFTRATYTNISENHFTWRGEKSNDGKSWEEFMVIEAYRAD